MGACLLSEHRPPYRDGFHRGVWGGISSRTPGSLDNDPQSLERMPRRNRRTDDRNLGTPKRRASPTSAGVDGFCDQAGNTPAKDARHLDYRRHNPLDQPFPGFRRHAGKITSPAREIRAPPGIPGPATPHSKSSATPTAGAQPAKDRPEPSHRQRTGPAESADPGDGDRSADRLEAGLTVVNDPIRELRPDARGHSSKPNCVALATASS